MSKIGLFSKDCYKLENITKATAKVPIAQAHFMLMLGVFLGGGTFLLAFLANAHRFSKDIELIPEYILMMVVGWMVFSFFLPMACLIYLFKEIQMLKDKTTTDVEFDKEL
ncbi:MAG: hypothetical protein ACYTFX_07670 [Planctomycetota bacterium]|jgi:hypothetical protein